MSRSIWTKGAKPCKVKEAKASFLPLEKCVSFPLYLDLEDELGPMILDQGGKSIYKIATQSLCPWVFIMSEEDQKALLAIAIQLL